MHKEKFLKDEIWLLTLMGAFQRANIYKKDIKEINDEAKQAFKNKLRGYLENLAETTYQSKVSPELHIDKINALSDYTEHFSPILNGGKLNFGASQKLLNLYLKYCWVLDKIPTPPHFPVDSIIQKKLKLNPVPWTKMSGKKGEEQYLKIVEVAQSQLDKYECKTVAELELFLFERS